MTARINGSNKNGRSEKRRSNKPLMEKRRRARINQSLSVLKSIILQDSTSLDQRSNCKGSASQSRLEKADILELTVTHLRSLEKERRERKALDSNLKHGSPSFCDGYETCVQDVRQYLCSKTSDQPITEPDLLGYLQNKLEGLDKSHSSPESSNFSTETPDSSKSDVNVTPTRLPDGRLALIFSSNSTWISFPHQKPQPETSSSSISVPSDVIRCSSRSPSPSPPPPVRNEADVNVWRPW